MQVISALCLSILPLVWKRVVQQLINICQVRNLYATTTCYFMVHKTEMFEFKLAHLAGVLEYFQQRSMP